MRVTVNDDHGEAFSYETSNTGREELCLHPGPQELASVAYALHLALLFLTKVYMDDEQGGLFSAPVAENENNKLRLVASDPAP